MGHPCVGDAIDAVRRVIEEHAGTFSTTES
jgi:hypothetical protein